jgi:hypothetical protein
MPIDERWDKLSDDTWSDFAAAWLAQIRVGEKEGDRDWGQSVVQMNFTARPEHQWKFILLAISQAQTDDELGHIAAGPIEHLLGWHGAQYIDSVEQQSQLDPKFARAVTGVLKYLMTDEVWERVNAIQKQAEPLRHSDKS